MLSEEPELSLVGDGEPRKVPEQGKFTQRLNKDSPELAWHSACRRVFILWDWDLPPHMWQPNAPFPPAASCPG